MLNVIKNFRDFFIILFIVLFFFQYQKEISTFITDFIYSKKEIVVKDSNLYAKGYDFEKYQSTTDFSPSDYKDLLNIFYTILNSGWNDFYFYCDDSYKTCLSDATEIIQNETLLSSINNYVSPYNSYSTFLTTMDNYGKITVKPKYNYNESMIKMIDEKIDAFIVNNINDSMDTRTKIKAFHDFVINNTKYDSIMVDTGVNNYYANLAFGPMIHGKAICGGYSDAMAIYLDKIGVNNYKIASDDHVWNYVFVDNAWYHLDLTWDDPVSTLGYDRLIYTYFLIPTETLKSLNTTGDHTYSDKLY